MPHDLATEEPCPLLVVDDDALFLRTFAANLVAGGYLPHCFTDPQAALLAIQDGSVEVAACVLDLDMPGIDGLQFLQTLRESGRSPPVIFVTAHSEHVCAWAPPTSWTKAAAPQSFCAASRWH
jgi:CheY-like chemotaxis protein